MRVVILFNLDARLESGEYGEALAELSLKEEIEVIEQALRNLGHDVRVIPIQDATPIVSVFNLIYGMRPDVIFNLVEAVRGNASLEMTIPCLLDLMQIPYTGSGPLALGLCQDKARTKDILIANGVRTPSYYVTSDPFLTHVWNRWPSIIKPTHEDGSLGITKDSVVYCTEDLNKAIHNIKMKYRQPALIEEFIEGREFGVGIIDFNDGPVSFPVSEIIFDGYPSGIPKIVSYDSKWRNETIEYQESKPRCPADIPPDLATRLQHTAIGVFRLFGLKGYARIDVRVDADGMIYVLDVNGNADCAPGSGIHTMLTAAGMSYEEFVKNLIEGALRGK